MKNAYQQSLSALENQEDNRTEMLAGLLTAGFAAGGLLRTAADIASFFRTTSTVTNSDILVEETALYAALATALHKDIKLADNKVAEKKGSNEEDRQIRWKLFIPSVYPLYTVAAEKETSKLSTLLNELKAYYDRSLSHLEALKKLKDDHDQEIPDQLSEREPLLISLNDTFVKLQARLNTLNEETGLTVSSSIRHISRMAALLDRDGVFVIKLAAKSTGSHKSYESMFRSPWIEFSGGTELSCLIFSKEGEVIYTFQTTDYIPLRKSDEVLQAE